MDAVQLAAYCIAMFAEYVQEPWLAELRDIYNVPTSGTMQGSCMAVYVQLSAGTYLCFGSRISFGCLH